MRRLACVLATSLAAFTGCLADDAKGEEDDVPLDGKDDSFVNPSSHGALSFATPNQAAFTDSEGFHSWTFKLTATAKVKLLTDLQTQNLDTVMYLYKRTTASGSWGTVFAKNDDASSSTAASKLDLELGKAEYRVLVKAYKRTQRGAFSVTGTCSGAGCPTTTSCAAPVDLPSSTGYGGTCGTKLAGIFRNGTIDATQSITSSVDDRCSAPPLQRKAVDYYKSYFPDLEDDAELSVDTQELGGSGSDGGTVIAVSDGGDESSMSFVFDPDGKLVVLYQSNQSPDVQFFCKSSSAAEVALPNVEDCVSDLVYNLPHGDGDESDVALTAAPNNLPVGLGQHVSRPMQRYASANSTANAQLTVDGAAWDLYDGKASRLTITASGKPATSFLATSDRILLEAPTGKPAQLVCQ